MGDDDSGDKRRVAMVARVVAMMANASVWKGGTGTVTVMLDRLRM